MTVYIKKRVRLKSLNTFSIDVLAEHVVTIYDEYTLLNVWKKFFDQNIPVLILGEGSNVLFLENYSGAILLNRIKGIFVTEHKRSWKLHVGSGEKWSNLVVYTLNNKIPGLENLACIPGYVGAAPIHNIGAYGLELSQICEYVDVLELKYGRKMRFTADECNFQYRDSIFRQCVDKYAVVFVGLRLPKYWKPMLKYYELSHLRSDQVTPYQIFNFICLIRQKKLPDPIRFGNAGSFFKNPIIKIQKAHYLFQVDSNMPYVIQKNNKIKLSAAWLIERCKLKGYVFGEASVYYKQALILINTRQRATGTEIAALAFFIYNKVFENFNICLEFEVRLIGNLGEVHLKQLFI